MKTTRLMLAAALLMPLAGMGGVSRGDGATQLAPRDGIQLRLGEVVRRRVADLELDARIEAHQLD